MRPLKSSKLNNLKIVNQCKENWYSIEKQNGYCEKCEKHVHDLSKLTKAQTLKLLKENPNQLCIRILRDANNDIIFTKNNNYLKTKKHLAKTVGFYFTYLITNLTFDEKSYLAVAETSNNEENKTQVNDLCKNTNEHSYSCSKELDQLVELAASNSININHNVEGPVGTFGEAAYEDELARNSIVNLFKLIEGSLGFWLMLSTGILAIIAALYGYNISAIGLFSFTTMLIIARAIISIFFGTDYTDYEN